MRFSKAKIILELEDGSKVQFDNASEVLITEHPKVIDVSCDTTGGKEVIDIDRIYQITFTKIGPRSQYMRKAKP